MPLPQVVQPHLDQLSEEIGESSSVSILDDAEIVYVARAAQRKVMSIALMPGLAIAGVLHLDGPRAAGRPADRGGEAAAGVSSARGADEPDHHEGRADPRAARGGAPHRLRADRPGGGDRAALDRGSGAQCARRDGRGDECRSVGDSGRSGRSPRPRILRRCSAYKPSCGPCCARGFKRADRFLDAVGKQVARRERRARRRAS